MVTRHRTIFVAAALVALTACTVHKQSEAPPLTGPSDNALSVTVNVSPDVLTQDGASQSLVTVQTFGPNGQPLRAVQLRAEIVVGGAPTDFGSLSARNLVTDSNGRTSFVYTAPPAPVFNNDVGTVVEIRVTPIGNDFANTNSRAATIRLVPPGVVGPPQSPLRPDFIVPAATQGNPAVFNATVIDSAGNDAIPQVAQFLWTFGDGSSGSGRSVTHTFGNPGTFAVTLTIVDTLGRTVSTTHSLTIGQGTLPTATFLISPLPAIVDVTLNFNATGSQAEPGHRITDFHWNFGDGVQGGGDLATHSYNQTGTYVVTLQTTDDVGRKSLVAAQTITVGNGNPTADFTFNPSAPTSGSNVAFDGSPSLPSPGRTIVSYSWSFGDGNGGSGQVVNHQFFLSATDPPTRTFNVLLTVTDNAGKTGSITKSVTVSK